MGWRSRGFGWVGALAVAAVAAAPTARADIISEGTKWVETRVELSAGRYADWCERAHVVAEGDTLASIVRAAYGDEARVAEVLRANALPADGLLKPGMRLVLPAKTAEPADAAEPLAWEFWLSYYDNGPLEEARRIRPGDFIKGPHRTFALVALPVAKSADFAKLLRERPQAQFDAGIEAELPWLVVSRRHSSGRVVDRESEAVRCVATCTFDEVRPAPRVDKRWTFVRTLDYFDEEGKKVPGRLGAGSVDFARAWPLVALSGLGALLLVVLRRRSESRRWSWLAPAVAALLLAPAARADILIDGTKPVASSARLVVAESAQAEGAPAWEFWRVGDGGPLTAKRIAPGEALERDSSWGFRLVAVAADHAAEFEALQKAKRTERYDAPWDTSLDWLVASGSIDLPKAVDDDSPVARIDLTYELRAADPAKGGKAWQIVAADVEHFDDDGRSLTDVQSLGGWGGRSIAPLLLVALLGGFWLWLRGRPGLRAR